MLVFDHGVTNFRRSLRFRICYFSGTIEQLLLNRRIKTLRDQEERKRKREQKEESTAHQTNGDDADLEKPRAFRRVVLAQGPGEARIREAARSMLRELEARYDNKMFDK